jgi:hypothetical protein
MHTHTHTHAHAHTDTHTHAHTDTHTHTHRRDRTSRKRTGIYTHTHTHTDTHTYTYAHTDTHIRCDRSSRPKTGTTFFDIVVTLLLHCCYNVVTLLLHFCYTAVTLYFYQARQNQQAKDRNNVVKVQLAERESKVRVCVCLRLRACFVTGESCVLPRETADSKHTRERERERLEQCGDGAARRERVQGTSACAYMYTRA